MSYVIRRGFSALRRFYPQFPRLQPARTFAVDDDGSIYQKTTVSVLNQEQDEGIFVDSYSKLGFRLNNGIRVVGPCAIFPRSVLHWNVQNVLDINEESLALFTMLEPKIDILVLGIGERENLDKVNMNVIRYLRSNKINVELLPTDQALSTFNFLNAEKRYVAGAFIPPTYVNVSEDEDVFAGVPEENDPAVLPAETKMTGYADDDITGVMEEGKKLLEEKLKKRSPEDKYY